jgi:hypothetical protein
MAVALSIFGIAFAALCVLLTVRIVNRGERWAKWALAVTIVGVPLLYVASLLPACWICSRLNSVALPEFYYPIGGAARRFPARIWIPLERCVKWGMAPGSEILIPVGGTFHNLVRSE